MITVVLGFKTDHPTKKTDHPFTGQVEVSVTESLKLEATVISTYQDGNGVWRYQLQTTFTDGNNVETVELHEVAQCLVTSKE